MSEFEQAIGTILEAQALPIKQWEDDDFAQRLFRAERLVESFGLPDRMTEWLIDREMHKRALSALQITDNESRSTAKWHLREMDELDGFLSHKAHDIKLAEDTREALNIPKWDPTPMDTRPIRGY